VSDMSDAAFRDARIERAWEPPEEVVVSNGIAYSPFLQPEDYGVLIRLLLRDPRLPSTMAAMAAEMRESGWKMGDDRFRVIFNRLKKAGHVKQVSEYNATTERPEWVIRVYRNPANNDQYVALGIEASSQVSGGSGKNPDSAAGPGGGSGKTRVSPGQSGSGIFPDPGPDPGFSGSGKTRVPRGQRPDPENPDFASPPPHPPEEVDTSSPYPLADQEVGAGGSAAPTGEEVDVSAEKTAAAEQFLMTLPGQWRCGRKSAKTLAPVLAVAAREQGWQLDDVLVAELTKNPGGIRRFSSVLSGRIEDLPLREGAARNGSGPRSALAPWCGECNYGEEPDSPVQRRRELPSGAVVPCPKCHPGLAQPIVPAPTVSTESGSMPESVQQLVDRLRKPAG